MIDMYIVTYEKPQKEALTTFNYSVQFNVNINKVVKMKFK